MKGWRKTGAFALVVILAAFSDLTVTAELVALFAVFCGVNGVEHWLKKS